MVTARKIRCFVVVADTENDRMPQRTQPRFRPSDLLPWADPHIRSLVEQLQDEVREENRLRRELEPPRPSSAELESWAELDSQLAAVESRRRF